MAPISRRDAFKTLAITASGGLMISQTAYAQGTGVNSSQAATLLNDADICIITPEVTEGPYYFDPKLERVDITEGRAGVPLRLRMQVVDEKCAAIDGARVDIWHCDALGLYSGYRGQGDNRDIDTSGETFMRGTQFADANGIVAFDTVYPSWYSGRTTHIHFKVFISESEALTGQLYFPDAVSEYIFTNIAPYNQRNGKRDTLNATDGIAQQSSRASFVFLKEEEERYLAAMIIGVDPNGNAPRNPRGPRRSVSGDPMVPPVRGQ